MLTSKQVRERLGISRTTLFRWMKEGKIGAKKHGKANIFDEREIQRYLATLPNWKPASGPNADDSKAEQKSGAETYLTGYYWITRIPKPPGT